LRPRRDVSWVRAEARARDWGLGCLILAATVAVAAIEGASTVVPVLRQRPVPVVLLCPGIAVLAGFLPLVARVEVLSATFVREARRQRVTRVVVAIATVVATVVACQTLAGVPVVWQLVLLVPLALAAVAWIGRLYWLPVVVPTIATFLLPDAVTNAARAALGGAFAVLVGATVAVGATVRYADVLRAPLLEGDPDPG